MGKGCQLPINFQHTNGQIGRNQSTYSPIRYEKLPLQSSQTINPHSYKSKKLHSHISQNTIANKQHQNGKEKGTEREEGSQDLQD